MRGWGRVGITKDNYSFHFQNFSIKSFQVLITKISTNEFRNRNKTKVILNNMGPDLRGGAPEKFPNSKGRVLDPTEQVLDATFQKCI